MTSLSTSVIIPAHNAASCLETCLASVQAQAAEPAEVIVVDDGSTDGSATIADDFGMDVTVIRQEHRGQGAARNAGIQAATGAFIAFLDADDYWKPGFLASCVPVLEAYPEAVAVSTGGVVQLPDGSERPVPASRDRMGVSPMRLEDFFGFWAEHDHLRTGTVLLRHQALRAAGGQRDDLRISQDLEYWAYLGTFGPWFFLPLSLWVGQSHVHGMHRGWREKYAERRQLCPTVESWEARVWPRVPEGAMADYARVRGRVAAGYAHARVLGGDTSGAREIVARYGSDMHTNRVTRLMRRADLLGCFAWWAACLILRGREGLKDWCRGGRGRRGGPIEVGTTNGAGCGGGGQPVTGGAGGAADPAKPLKVVWISRSFLHYRIPVFAALRDALAGNLRVVYSGDYVPVDVQEKARAVLGDAAAPLSGEWKLGREDRHFMANRNISVRYQPGLYRYVVGLKPDVVIVDGFFKWSLAGIRLRRHRRVPLVITYERTVHTERHAQALRTWYRRRVVGVADAMVCSGSLCRDYAISLGMPSERIRLGHMTADVEGFRARSQGLTTEARERLRDRFDLRGVVFICVSRLVEGKGCRELLQAWARAFGGSSRPASLLFVGEGPLRDELNAAVSQPGLDSIRLAGAVPHAELATYYTASDVLVMPTLEDNWSLVVPEAMACGLPVMCSCYNGCHPELVHQQQNGIVFDPLDVAGFADGLVRMTGADLGSMGEASRRIVADYGPQKAAEALLAACRMAVGRRRT